MAHVAGTVDIEDRFEPTICCDIRSLCPHAVRKLYGRPDFLWFSPPCTEFSRLNRKKRQERDYEVALALVERCLEFIHILQPSRGFVIENPRGGDLESFAVLKMVKKNAFDYCCFGPFPRSRPRCGTTCTTCKINAVTAIAPNRITLVASTGIGSRGSPLIPSERSVGKQPP